MIFIFQDYFKEFRYNLKLAYPVIISLLGHTFVQLMDNVMVGQLGTADLAAVSLGNSFLLICQSPPLLPRVPHGLPIPSVGLLWAPLGSFGFSFVRWVP